MLCAARIKPGCWPYALPASTYLNNRSYHEPRAGIPCDFGKQPSVSHLRVFGARGYSRSPADTAKFKARGRPVIFLGYSSDKRSYIWVRMTKRLEPPVP